MAAIGKLIKAPKLAMDDKRVALGLWGTRSRCVRTWAKRRGDG
jgi:hypothetical protein